MTQAETTEGTAAEVERFMGVVAVELAASASTALAILGDRLGLYRSLAAAGPSTSSELAARTGCAERYVREWLFNQAAGNWLVFDEDSQRFTLPPAHAAVIADESSPALLAGSMQVSAPSTAPWMRWPMRSARATASDGANTTAICTTGLLASSEQPVRPHFRAGWRSSTGSGTGLARRGGCSTWAAARAAPPSRWPWNIRERRWSAWIPCALHRAGACSGSSRRRRRPRRLRRRPRG